MNARRGPAVVRWREIFALAVILGLAGLLRMGWPGLTEFKQDEARLYALALSLARFEAFPLHGIEFSVGFPNSPVSVYLYALPLILWKSPLAATLFVGLLNTAAVGLTYALVRRYWGRRAGALAALLYAVAPWAIIYSRKLWSNNLLPLFVVGAVYSALLSFVEARPRWLAVHLVVLALAVQIHIYGLMLVPLTGLLLLVYRRRVAWRMAAYGLAGAALTAAPYLAYVAGEAGRLGDRLAARAPSGLRLTGDAVRMSAMLIQGTDLHSLAGPAAYQSFLATVPPLDPVMRLGGALVLLGAAYQVVRAAQSARRALALPHADQAGLIVSAWLFLTVALFVPVPSFAPVFPHYLVVMLPAPFVLTGLLLDGMMTRLRPTWQQTLIWLLPLALAGAQVWQTLALLRFVGSQHTPGAFGTPLGRMLAVVDAIDRLGTQDVVVVSEGADLRFDLVPAVFDVLLASRPHRFADGRTTAVLPAGEATVVVWPGTHSGLDLYYMWAGGSWEGRVPLRAGEGEVLLARGPGTLPLVPRPREASALLANGAELLGSGGHGRTWQLWWRVTRAGEGEDYQVFAHLLDESGGRVAQVDQAALPTRYWRAGDLVVSYFALSAEGTAVRAGMYAYPSLAPAAVLDALGEPAGEWLIFPLGPGG